MGQLKMEINPEFVSIPIHVIKTKNDKVTDRHKNNIEKIMMKNIQEVPQTQASRDNSIVAAQTLPTPRKFNHNHSDGGLVLRQRPNTSFNLPFGGRYDSESENCAKENLNKSEDKRRISSSKRERSLDDIDKDIEQIWRGIEDFKKVGSQDDLVPPPLPPKSPKLLARSKSFTKKENTQNPKSAERNYNSSGYSSNSQLNSSVESDSGSNNVRTNPNLTSNISFSQTDSIVKTKPPLNRSNSMPCRRRAEFIQPRQERKSSKAGLKSCLLSNNRYSSDSNGQRSRSQTPSKVTFLQSREKNIEKQEEQSVNSTIVTKDQKTIDSEESFEWVDFRAKEGLPRGIILPENLHKSVTTNDTYEDMRNNFNDDQEDDSDDEYYSADEECNFSKEIVEAVIKVDVSTQTDSNLDRMCAIS